MISLSGGSTVLNCYICRMLCQHTCQQYL